MQILTFSKDLFQYYKHNVKGNENIVHDKAQRKMTRNMLLAYKFNSDNHSIQLYQYGKLKFGVKKGTNQIVWMRNDCRPIKEWYKDINKYNELNEKLGIK